MKIVTGELEEWAGMKTEVVARSKNSGIKSTKFPWSEAERNAMTAYIEKTNDQFIDKGLAGLKAAGQKLTREDLLKVAGGRVWTGWQAKERGLIDELCTCDDAIAETKSQAGIDPKKELERLVLPRAGSFIDKFINGDVKLPFSKMTTEFPGAEKALCIVGPLLRTQLDAVNAFLPLQVEFK